MRFLILEAYYGGSHKEFLDGLTTGLPYGFALHTLPARHWKWRMRGAALSFLREIPDLSSYDGIFATNMLSIAEFRGMAGSSCPPVLLYFHENQFDYPISSSATEDMQPALTDLTSAVAADRIAFNSASHMERFFSAADATLRRLPKPRVHWALESIRKKSRVLYPGCRIPDTPERGLTASFHPQPRLIIWNHRWEHDKNPRPFFDALFRLKAEGVPFSLALLGERYRHAPSVFSEAMEILSDRIVNDGYPQSRDAYLNWLAKGDIVVSTAMQENFGISVVEAVASGCLPILPDRLSYPELVPESLHSRLLYQTDGQLYDRLYHALTCPGEERRESAAVFPHIRKFSWSRRHPAFIQELEALAAMGSR